MKPSRYFLFLFFLFFFAFNQLAAITPENETRTDILQENQHPGTIEKKPSPFLSDENDLENDDKGMSHFFQQFLNMMVTLLMVIIVILIISWLLKKLLNTRMQQLNQSSLIKIVERRSLSPKSTIYIVEVNGKGLAIAESASGIQKLSDVSLAETTSFENKGMSFEKVLEGKEKGPKSL